MNHLHVRCPSCAKLYMIDVATIFSTSPHFQCLDCKAKFTFDFPPANPADIKARVVTPDPVLEPTASVEAAGLGTGVGTGAGMSTFRVQMRKCPKCGAESPKTADECYSCHVIFERLEGLPTDPSIRAQPSLVRRWKELLNDYADESLHRDFILACRKLGALEFAKLKYEHIRKVQGVDPIADRMIAQIEALQSIDGETRKSETGSLFERTAAEKAAAGTAGADAEGASGAGFGLGGDGMGAGFMGGSGAGSRTGAGGGGGGEATPAQVAKLFFLKRWRMMAFFSPLMVSLILILWGMSHASARNMIGAGIAISLLSYGGFWAARRGFR